MSQPASSSILHVDMDAFYASVEERENPDLRGQPVVVGGSPDGRGVVAAANYEARKFGVHSAMPAAQARRLCPHAVFIRSRMNLYAGVSSQLREIFFRVTPMVEPLSLDEAFLDVAASVRLFGEPLRIAQRLKADIRSELGLVASVGVAPNKFLAKLASDLSKPDGLIAVNPGEVDAFLSPLPVTRLWGVGAASERKLNAMGVYTVADLRRESAERLESRLGAWGLHIWELAHGRDSRKVVSDRDAKSISHETTFETDIVELRNQRAWLLELTEQVCARLRRHELTARTVEIKLRYGDFTTVTRSKGLYEPTDRTRTVWRQAASLLDTQWRRRPDPVRLLGCGVSGIGRDQPRQSDLFSEVQDRRQAKIDGVVDAISERFGKGALARGTTVRD